MTGRLLDLHGNHDQSPFWITQKPLSPQFELVCIGSTSIGMGNEQSGGVVAPSGRRPNDHEVIVLFKLQKKLFARLVESPVHLALLERYWRASTKSSRGSPPFVRCSPLWREKGGFSSDNPAGDLRCGGELGLQSLVYFAETYPAEAAMMKRGRGGYPFVKAATALVRALSEVLHLVDDKGHAGDFPITNAFFWRVLEDEESFYRLFSLLMLHFEELYCEEVARNRALLDMSACSTAVVVRLVDECKAHLVVALQQAPSSLEQLRDMCSNSAAILNAPRAMTPTAAAPVQQSPWSGRVVRRKSVIGIGENWGKLVGTDHGENGHRLQPRMPEIVRSTSERQRRWSITSSSSAGLSSCGSPLGHSEQETTAAELRSSLASKVSESPCDASPDPPEDLFRGLVVSKLCRTLPVPSEEAKGSTPIS